MILNYGQPEAWRVHTIDDAAPTLYAERPPAILQAIRKKGYKLLFPLDFVGTLCARDGIKTGPHTPNGEDAYDRKLIVTMRKKSRKFFSNHQTTSDIQEVDIAPCMGASRNLGPSNNNPLVVTCFSNPQDHSVTRGYMKECAPTLNAAAGASGNNRPFIVASKKTAIAVLDRCGNNWKNGKGGCGPLLHKEYAPTVATMFQPFIVRKKG